MASTAQLNSLPITPVLTEFTDCMDRRKTPAEVLDTLHTLASKYLWYFGSGGGAFSRPDLRLEVHAAWQRCVSSPLGAARLVGGV